MRPVTVQFFKQWGRLHWRHDMLYLGEDEHGTWLGGPAGSIVQKGHEPPKEWPVPFVQLIPRHEWWTVLFNGEFSDDFRQYVDIIEPARWVSGDHVEMVDLDIDVVETALGDIAILDQDEFDQHAAAYDYPPHLIEAAQAARDQVAQALTDRREPFFRAGERWLDRIAG